MSLILYGCKIVIIVYHSMYMSLDQTTYTHKERETETVRQRERHRKTERERTG